MRQAPFPYFGGKSRIAADVWERFGDPANYVEPLFGSGAVLLARPQWDWELGDWCDEMTRTETVNDADGLLANAWRAMQRDPEAAAYHADHPVSEVDLHARHTWLVGRSEDITARLMGEPDWFDAKAAGWWIWGICCWIGSGWCSGKGPWQSVDGQLVHLGAGQGVNRQLVHLGDAGQGVKRKLVHLGAGKGVNRKRAAIQEWFGALSARLRGVRVCCGDWTRVLGPTPTTKLGLTAVFLDPPYSLAERHGDLYRREGDIAGAVRDWALAHGDDPQLRVALCGYDREHEMPRSWELLAWKAHGGYGWQGEGRGRENATRERVWFSPGCLRPDRPRQMAFADVTP